MNNKINKFFTPAKILAIVSIFCAALIAVSFFSDKLVSPLREAVSFVVIPLQRGVNGLGIGVVRGEEKKKTIEELQAYSSELEEKVAYLEAQNEQLKSGTKELDEIKKLYEMDQSTADYHKVGATIIGISSQNWNESFIINKGAGDGMETDMNVISADGLVGIITEVHGNYSKVMTIVSDNSYVTAMDEATKDQCTVKGDISLLDSGKIRLERMKADVAVKDGDRIVTSNISSKYLPGLFIGYASDIKEDETGMTRSGYLIPAVDFDHLQNVLVITQKKQTTQGD